MRDVSRRAEVFSDAKYLPTAKNIVPVVFNPDT